MGVTFPGESAEYRAAREALLQREIELRREIEAVAAERRALPPGGAIPEDYTFHGAGTDGAPAEIRLSELFGRHRSLVVYSMMFPRDSGDDRPGLTSGAFALLPLVEMPCPSCVAFLDPLDGAVQHLVPHVAFAVVAKAPIERLLGFGRERGWQSLRLLSSRGTTFNRDYNAETAGGEQRPMMNVFERSADGVIRHAWGSELLYAPIEPGQDTRHVGLMEPSWNIFDLTREGRGVDWDELFEYPSA